MRDNAWIEGSAGILAGSAADTIGRLTRRDFLYARAESVPVNPISIHAFNPGPMTGDGNWTWLLRGRVATLVDAGTGDARHLDAVEKALDGVALRHVIVTHSHSDHASGAPALASRFPGVRFLKIPWPARDDRWPARWEPLKDGQVVDAGDTTLRVVHTPGHAPDHVCLWHEDTRTLFGSDLAIAGRSVHVPSAPLGDLSAYLASLECIRRLSAARILPAHGPVIDDPAAVLSEYVRHRHEREQQVLAGLSDGYTSPETLLAVLYPDLDPALSAIARDTIVAHLQKLERDGHVRRDDATEVWHLARG